MEKISLPWEGCPPIALVSSGSGSAPPLSPSASGPGSAPPPCVLSAQPRSALRVVSQTKLISSEEAKQLALGGKHKACYMTPRPLSPNTLRKPPGDTPEGAQVIVLPTEPTAVDAYLNLQTSPIKCTHDLMKSISLRANWFIRTMLMSWIQKLGVEEAQVQRELSRFCHRAFNDADGDGALDEWESFTYGRLALALQKSSGANSITLVLLVEQAVDDADVGLDSVTGCSARAKGSQDEVTAFSGAGLGSQDQETAFSGAGLGSEDQETAFSAGFSAGAGAEAGSGSQEHETFTSPEVRKSVSDLVHSYEVCRTLLMELDVVDEWFINYLLYCTEVALIKTSSDGSGDDSAILEPDELRWNLISLHCSKAEQMDRHASAHLLTILLSEQYCHASNEAVEPDVVICGEQQEQRGRRQAWYEPLPSQSEDTLLQPMTISQRLAILDDLDATGAWYLQRFSGVNKKKEMVLMAASWWRKRLRRKQAILWRQQQSASDAAAMAFKRAKQRALEEANQKRRRKL